MTWFVKMGRQLRSDGQSGSLPEVVPNIPNTRNRNGNIYVGLCMAMQGYLGLCMVIYGYVWLCLPMYGHVWLCRAMYGYVRLCMAMYGYVLECVGMQGHVWSCMGMYGYVQVCRAMQSYVGLCIAIHSYVVTSLLDNVKPVHDSNITYLPKGLDWKDECYIKVFIERPMFHTVGLAKHRKLICLEPGNICEIFGISSKISRGLLDMITSSKFNSTTIRIQISCLQLGKGWQAYVNPRLSK